MRVLLATLALAAASVTIAGAAATPSAPCAGHVMSVGGAAYVVVDDSGDLNSYWAYVERNGQPGLQRGGTSLLGDTELCQESVNPDLTVF